MDPVFKSLNLDKSDQIPPGVDVKTRRISGWLSTIQMDRDGEVVLPSAFEKHLDVYKANPVLFLFHQHKSLPIGKAVNIEVRSEGLWGEFQIAKTQTGDEVLQLVAEGCLRGFSAGFVPIDYEENPSPYKIPAEAMRTSMGRKPKKLYREVELVETSLLGIPSNRGSLISQVEKGNKVAGLVVKAFDATEKGEDISLIIKEWMRENTSYTLKSLLKNSEPLEMKYTLKSLLWEESEHPRNNSGQFASKPDSYEPYKDIWSGRERIDPGTGRAIRLQDQAARYEERMDRMVEQQKESNRQLGEISDKSTWTSWFAKWATILAAGVGLYFGYKKFKKTKLSAAIRNDARKWLASQTTKEFAATNHPDILEFNSVLNSMTSIKTFLEKGQTLGLQETPEYKKAEKLYASGLESIKKIAESDGGKVIGGLKGLIDGIVIKEMSAEEFEESEHPRATDGKFRKKDGSGVQKAKPSQVDDSIEKIEKARPIKVTQALDHPDEPGAGAAKRRELNLTPHETFRAVMAEFKRGTLRSGSGEVVTDSQQAKAIALSEARKANTEITIEKKSKDVKDSFSRAGYSKEEAHTLVNWAKQNKGKMFLAGLGLASIPAVYTTAKFSGRLFNAIHSASGGKVAVWNKITPAQRKAFYANAQAGDIYLMGGNPYTGFTDAVSDLVKMGKGKGTKSKQAKERLYELLGNAALGSRFTHTGLIVGKYDEAFHYRIVKEFVEGGKKNLLLTLKSLGILDEKNSTIIKNIGNYRSVRNAILAVKNGKATAEQISMVEKYEKLLTTPNREMLGNPLLVGIPDISKANDLKKPTSMFIYVDKGPLEFTTQSKKNLNTAAILRTRIDEDVRNEMSRNIIEDVISDTKVKFRFSFSLENFAELSKSNADYFLHHVGDPLTKRMSEVMFREDGHLMCSGFIAELYNKYAPVAAAKLGKEKLAKIARDTKYYSPVDLMTDEKFAGVVLEAQKKEKYSVLDWKDARTHTKEEGTKRSKIAAGAGLAAGVSGGVLTTAAILKRRRDRLQKGLSRLLVQKEMTAEQFEESEHPRDESGKFTDKPGGGTTPAITQEKPKKSWGGKRTGSGRVPDNPVSAYAKLKEKFLAQNPQMTEEEVKAKVVDFARENLKTDLLVFTENPGAYYEKKAKEQEDALLDKYNKIVVNKRAVKTVRDSSDTDELVARSKLIKSSWDREVAKAGEVISATNTFNSRESTEVEKQKARLLLGIATLSTIVGIVALLARKKSPGAFGLNPIKDLGNAGIRVAREVDPKTGRPLATEVVPDTLIRWLKAVDYPKSGQHVDEWTEIADYSIVRKWIGKALKAVGFGKGEAGNIPVAGPGLMGYFESRFRLPRMAKFKRSANYVPKPGDLEGVTGRNLRLIEHDGTPNWLNIVMSRGNIPLDAPNWNKLDIPQRSKYGLIGLRSIGDDVNGWNWDVVSHQAFENWLVGEAKVAEWVKTAKGEEKVAKTLKLKKDQLPKYIIGSFLGKGSQSRETWETAAKAYKTWWDTDIIPYVSRRLMARLAAVGSVSSMGAYYFESDIESAFKDVKDSSRKAAEAAEASAQKQAGQETVDKKDIDKLIALSKSRQAEAESKKSLESLRLSAINSIVAEGFRKKKEGVVTPFSHTITTLMQKHSKKVFDEMNLTNAKAILEFQRKIESGDEEILDETLKRAVGFEIQEYLKKGLPLPPEVEQSLKQSGSKHEKKLGANFDKLLGNYKKLSKEMVNMSDEERAAAFAKLQETYAKAQEEKLSEIKKAQAKTEKSMDDDLILKEMSDDIVGLEDDVKNKFNEFIISVVTYEVSKMMTDMSQCCRDMIESKVPGYSDFVDINKLLVDHFVKMKELASSGNKPETKSFDGMSSQSDKNGGIFVGTEHELKEKCPKCGKAATNEVIGQCDVADCPYSFLKAIETKE